MFLGTKGGPRVETGRSNPANLIEINGTRIVLDCGMGVSHQLAEAQVSLTSLKYILISHHHSDHNLEYGNLVYNAWVSGLTTPIHSFGPKGLEGMDSCRKARDPCVVDEIAVFKVVIGMMMADRKTLKRGQ